MYWIPQSTIDEYYNNGNRRGRDAVPYDLWKRQGYLRTTPDGKVDKKVFLDWFLELRETQGIYPLYIGYDPWHMDDSLLRSFRNYFGKNAMIPVRQGTATLSQPMKDMVPDFRNGLFVYDNNPIDKWCLINTSVNTDINGNIQPIKGNGRTGRIDGTMALIDAYVVKQKKKDEFMALI